jgi:hypothetical protein
MTKTKKKQFWPGTHLDSNFGAVFEARSELALRLLHSFGLVAGTRGTEDRTGRATVDLLPVDQTVARCFELADTFFDTALARGEVREHGDAETEKSFERGGHLSRVRDKAQYPRSEEKFEKLVHESDKAAEQVGGKPVAE